MFNTAISLIAVSLFIATHIQYIIFFVAMIFVFFTSDERIDVLLNFISKDDFIQIAFAKRLADWSEKMSSATLVGCIIGYINSGTMDKAKHDVSPQQFMFILCGVSGVFVSAFIAFKLTIYIKNREYEKHKNQQTM